ncbi:hypothetical protein QBC41DRAFT_345683 [Cercophora samala]|uniref:Uncharacterized protein n=1 Tax=Cercophora samala TaxID=330535 RepID=A0AA39ZGI2_9PEZI|nr:hypothetical protein QBC41DRAFT_345683 [Cercophora samala]
MVMNARFGDGDNGGDARLKTDSKRGEKAQGRFSAIIPVHATMRPVSLLPPSRPRILGDKHDHPTELPSPARDLPARRQCPITQLFKLSGVKYPYDSEWVNEKLEGGVKS